MNIFAVTHLDPKNGYRTSYVRSSSDTAEDVEAILKDTYPHSEVKRAEILSSDEVATIKEMEKERGISMILGKPEEATHELPLLGGTYVLVHWVGGESQDIAAVKFGPLWTAVWQMAQDKYGAANLTYRFVPNDHEDGITF